MEWDAFFSRKVLKANSLAFLRTNCLKTVNTFFLELVEICRYFKIRKVLLDLQCPVVFAAVFPLGAEKLVQHAVRVLVHQIVKMVDSHSLDYCPDVKATQYQVDPF